MLKPDPLASDSTGVRSMATFIKTPDISVIIDPGAALGPLRSGLPPHRIEIDRLKHVWERIMERFEMAHLVIITHYHYDHLNPQEMELFRNKGVFLKDPNTTNSSQSRRGKRFIERLRRAGISFEIADTSSLKKGNTKVNFSPPFPHGKDKARGMVLMVTIEYKTEKFLYSSDIQGIPRKDQLEYIEAQNPSMVFLDGPATYLLGDKLKREEWGECMENMEEMILKVAPKSIILDHHLTRDRNWRDKVKVLFETAKKTGSTIKTVAEFRGEGEQLLEANRKALYYQHFQETERSD